MLILVCMNHESASESQAIQTPPEPFVLSPSPARLMEREEERKRGFLGTLGLLLVGWLVGNLLVFSLLSLGTITVVAATGLVKIPFISEFFFGKPSNQVIVINRRALSEAQNKLSQIQNLQKGQVVNEIDLSETEINSLLDNQIRTNSSFPVVNPNLKILSNEFEFTARNSLTNAPIDIIAKIDVSSLTARVEIVSAKFGKINMPGILASSIIDSSLSKIGLSLNSSQIPAQTVSLADGVIKLQNVVNPNASGN